MIAKLRGILDAIAADSLILDVQGVGYHIYASRRTLTALPDLGQTTTIFIEYLIRQEQPQLFGFITKIEQEWFRLLITVQGVGAKVALGILSALNPEELAQALYTQDKTMICRADGVGPKLAGRITSELKDKGGTIGFAIPSSEISLKSGSAPDLIFTDAISALSHLGYRRAEATQAIAQAAQQLGPNAVIAELIRSGLAILSAVNRDI